jgi:hypothetical protein
VKGLVSQESEDAFNKLKVVVGDIVIAWGTLHGVISAMLGPTLQISDDVANAMLATLSVDAHQRNLITAAVRSSPVPPEMVAAVAALFQKIDKLSGERNAFIHTVWSYNPETEKLTGLAMPRLHGSLKEDALPQGAALVGAIHELRAEAAEIVLSLRRLPSRGKSS